MKRIALLFATMLAYSALQAQIPNAGFEQWATDLDSNYNPVGWQTTNGFPVVNVEPSVPGCQGNYAMKVKTLNMGFPFPGVAILQTAYNFSQAPTRFSACIKSNIMPGDRAFIIVALMRGDSIIASTDSCTFKIDSTISQFTYREFPIAVQSNLIPDSLLIMVASGLGNGQVGTELEIDEVAFRVGGSTIVSGGEVLPGSFILHQNYPNPFNPSTTIRYGLPRNSLVTLRIFNTLGQQVAQLVNEQQHAGYHETVFRGDGLASGVYFYRIHAGDVVAGKKLLLMK